MTDKPDFEALRAARNKSVAEMHRRIAEEFDIPRQALTSNFDPNRCYCACTSGGPCEHKWDGPDYESEDGCTFSVTCSRCGMTAMSHDFRTGP